MQVYDTPQDTYFGVKVPLLVSVGSIFQERIFASNDTHSCREALITTMKNRLVSAIKTEVKFKNRKFQRRASLWISTSSNYVKLEECLTENLKQEHLDLEYMEKLFLGLFLLILDPMLPPKIEATTKYTRLQLGSPAQLIRAYGSDPYKYKRSSDSNVYNEILRLEVSCTNFIIVSPLLLHLVLGLMRDAIDTTRKESILKEFKKIMTLEELNTVIETKNLSRATEILIIAATLMHKTTDNNTSRRPFKGSGLDSFIALLKSGKGYKAFGEESLDAWKDFNHNGLWESQNTQLLKRI